MFERFSGDARMLVTDAVTIARELRHDWVGTEHLLLAAAARSTGAGRALLRSAFDPQRARADLVRIVGMGPVLDAPVREDDARLLDSIGIDLEQVRLRAEAAFGPGALERRRRPLRGGRRTRVCGTPFKPRAKAALERSLDEAVALGHRHLGPEHIVLGLLHQRDSMAARLLFEQDVRPAVLRDAVIAELEDPGRCEPGA